MKRLFAAIKVHPSETFLAKYYALMRPLREEAIKWVDPQNIHITLRFFGETPEKDINSIVWALKRSAAGISPFNLEIRDTGIFGSSYKPRVIWFGIGQEEGLTTLAKNIQHELTGIGILPDRQNFVPHLTIARIKYLNNKKGFQRLIDLHQSGTIHKEEVKKFHLFESILRPQGPLYHIIESFELG
jgi:RNA 2',3'-cyclic 3'-phosphodiesterase